jgi:Ribonuclease G/E
MSKELIVSATRHETRVAVVEDDQVVEVFHQRENEYSLAGSIHKGRVTRVLPGMQSAFVDIGLERDAFLYVSDFFEDNEEYDKIVTSVEEKVLKMEKGAPPAVAAPAAPEPAGQAEPATESAVAPAATVSAPAAPEPFARRADERDMHDRDRRGRRSRRRRPKGRGLPESKFFSPAPRAEAASPVTEEVVENEAEDDVVVLPGESLAKYRRGEPSEAGDDPVETASETQDVPAAEVAPDPVDHLPLEAAAEAPAPEIAEENPETAAADRRDGVRRRGRSRGRRRTRCPRRGRRGNV